jgi:hypothetical protein
MARRFPSFLPVEGNLYGCLKTNDHLSEGHLGIFFIIGLSDLRQGITLLSLLYVDVAIFELRLDAPFAIGDWRKEHSQAKWNRLAAREMRPAQG